MKISSAAMASAFLLLVTSCANGTDTTVPQPTPTTAVSEKAQEAAAVTVATIALSQSIEHVHGLVVDGAGAVRAGTHEGVRVVTPTGEVTAVGPSDDLMGMTGQPGTMRLISSGHPGLGSQFPNPLGLIRSDDGGQSWESVSLTGEIDFHAMATTGDYIVGFDGVTGIVTSTDGGVTWTSGPAMAAAALAAVGDDVWATTADGVMLSNDRGATFSVLPGAPRLRLVTAASDDSLWGLDVDGIAWRSLDGRDWKQVTQLPEVEAVAALDFNTAYAINQTQLHVLSH